MVFCRNKFNFLSQILTVVLFAHVASCHDAAIVGKCKLQSFVLCKIVVASNLGGTINIHRTCNTQPITDIVQCCKNNV